MNLLELQRFVRLLSDDLYPTQYTPAYWLRMAADTANTESFWACVVRAYDEVSDVDWGWHMLDYIPGLREELHARECEAAGLVYA